MKIFFYKIDELRGKLSKLPDLERMISRVQAKAAKLSDFLSLLKSFKDLQVTILFIFILFSFTKNVRMP